MNLSSIKGKNFAVQKFINVNEDFAAWAKSS